MKDNFIDNIQYHLSDLDGKKAFDTDAAEMDDCYAVSPIIETSFNQRAPWDKFVIQEHPGCPVGCVAVASALVMTHSKDTLEYHGVEYPTNHILDVLKKGDNSLVVTNTMQTNATGGNFPAEPIFTKQYTYNEAVDSVAKILYLIGKDVNMQYGSSASSAYSKDAYELCKSIGLDIPSGWSTYNADQIVSYLSNGSIVYVRGRDYRKNAGHAWVGDGAMYCVDINDPSVIISTFIHCDWGWGGSCNGYFS